MEFVSFPYVEDGQDRIRVQAESERNLMEFVSFPYTEDAGTDFESQEEMSVLAIPYSYTEGGYYYLVNAHRGEHARFEVQAEEIDALLEALHWIKDHTIAHPRPVKEDEDADDADAAQSVEEDG